MSYEAFQPTLYEKVLLVKVVLITPYSGANLGDAAIQEAVIQNLRIRSPAIDIRMVTLEPKRTKSLHGVESLALTALEIPHYSKGIRAQARAQPSPGASAESADGPAVQSPTPVSQAKAALRKLPLLFCALRAGKAALRKLIRAPIALGHEVGNWIEAYRFSRGANYVIVSGGGQIDDYWGGPWGHPYVLMKWSILARRVGARFVVLSTGVCTLQSPLSRRFIKSALQRAAYRSYRDEASRDLLSYLPFTTDDPVYPDLAFSFPLERAFAPQRTSGSHERRTVGISPIAYLRSNWPQQDGQTYERYIAILTEFAKGLLRSGYSVVLFSSDGADRHPIQEMNDALAASADVDMSHVRSILPATIDELFALLAQVDVVVASRLHGILLSHLVHKPVLAISYDRKVDTHMDYMQQAENCLDIHRLQQVEIDAAFQSLVEQLDSIRRHVATVSPRLSELAVAQYGRAIGFDA